MNKKPLSLDFIITFIGGFWYLLQWDKTAIGKFIFFFLFSFLYLWLDFQIASGKSAKKEKKIRNQKRALWFTIIVFLLSTTIGARIFDKKIDHKFEVHDSQLQIEEAIIILLKKENPYSADYRYTDFGQIAANIQTTQGQFLVNPALFHFIYLPFHLLASVPFYLVANSIFGFFDERMLYLCLFFGTLLILYLLPEKEEDKLVLTSLFTFNPLFLPYFIGGENDIFVIFWLVLTVYLLKKERVLLSSLTLALACASKQSVWLFLPFYYAYLFFRNSKFFNLRSLVKQTWILPVTLALIIAPFFFWNPKAFYEDIFAYPAGTITTSYPINGYGVSVLLYRLGFVNKLTDYLPMWVAQVPLILVSGYHLIKKQRKDNSLSRLVFNYAVLIFVFLFFSRFFHDNYVGFISQLFLISYFI